LRIQVHATAFEGGLAKSLEADSLVFTVSSPDMEVKRFVFPGTSDAISLPDLTPGPDRQIIGQAYRKGIRICEGVVNLTLDPSLRSAVDLVMKPTFSRIRARILLSALEYPVTSGTLKLNGPQGEFNGIWRQQGATGSFLVDTLPEGRGYHAHIELRDNSGKLRYTSNRDSIDLNAGVEATLAMDLVPESITTHLALAIAEPVETQFLLNPPAGRRAPARSGELQMTEVYPIPDAVDSGSEGEWFEITNASSDTLSLAGCRLSRDKLEGDTRSFRFDSTELLPPGKVSTWGRGASGRQHLYKSFSLVNTSATLWLTCKSDSLTLDTLRYDGASHSEGTVAVREGEIMARRPSTLGKLGEMAMWCVTKVHNPITGNTATPGRLFPACGEE
jgi:hypothetical protein